jgi:hypothetical protein
MVLPICLLASLLVSHPAQAGAPGRARPYAEQLCSTDSNVFFCEDFEGEDINNFGSNNCGTTWGNPAIVEKDICWAGGGSYQRNTSTIPGFSSGNRVWRVTKSQGFTDVVTGRNTGTGGGTLAGWLDPTILGSGAREWYTRIQVWFSPDHTWPADYDFKMFFALPRSFVDPPSAAYETGMYFHQDFWCSNAGSFNDVPVIRYSSNFRMFPYQNEYCPPLSVGAAPNGRQAPRVAKQRWYTLEYHVKLASDNTGVLEFWVDGVKTYSSQRVTCHNGCSDMGYIMIMGWMNSADRMSGYYEIDNVVMSRSYIGPPRGADTSSTPTTSTIPPSPPTSLQVTQ